MSGLDIKVDTSGLAKLADAFGGAKGRAPAALSRALNRAGDRAKTKMAAVLPGQTGLKAGVFKRALKTKRASPGSLAFEIKSQGGNVSVKYFSARETKGGVTAAPWNARHLYPGAFTRGGRFPNRVKLKLGGHAYARVGGARHPLHLVDSGLFVPTEMVTGSSAEAFHATARTELETAMAAEIGRIFGGG